MPLAQLLNRPCTIVRRSASGSTDVYGNDVPTETSVSALCELQQHRSDEEDDQGEVSDTLWKLYLPKDTAVRTGDGVIVDGETYEVVGDPWHARNPRTKAESHIEATLRRTAGSYEEIGS